MLKVFSVAYKFDGYRISPHQSFALFAVETFRPFFSLLAQRLNALTAMFTFVFKYKAIVLEEAVFQQAFAKQ